MRLQALHNKAVRLINFRDKRTPTKYLLKEANILSVNQSIAYQILVQTFKIKASREPKYHFRRLFDEEGRLSRTRTDNMRRVDFRLNICRNSYFYQSSKLWTALPTEIKNESIINSFKRKLKTWIQDNIPVKP